MLNVCMIGHGMMGAWHSAGLQRAGDARIHAELIAPEVVSAVLLGRPVV